MQRIPAGGPWRARPSHINNSGSGRKPNLLSSITHGPPPPPPPHTAAQRRRPQREPTPPRPTSKPSAIPPVRVALCLLLLLHPVASVPSAARLPTSHSRRPMPPARP
ncbi:hypothetical protein PVAP13_9KG486426 [Panicum virgatum]|uniref:Uncharacterized protein n=1 Tax=Panicum virgatum TaxID=38727 RepID=A0A8T0NU18_PANVG|nr:hypothetical protein PVAP13_9KG486426 [Panicum virgatum]